MASVKQDFTDLDRTDDPMHVCLIKSFVFRS